MQWYVLLNWRPSKWFLQTFAGYTLSVRPLTYNNRDHRRNNGKCCDGISLLGHCLNECDNVFTFCLRNLETRRDDDATNCPLGQADTIGVIDDDSVNFSDWFRASVYIHFFGTVWPVSLPKKQCEISISSLTLWQGSAQLYIQVLDRDRRNKFQGVDDIYVPISLNPNPSLALRTITTGDHNRGTIKLVFTLTCWDNFFGRNCSIFCQPTEHFTCSVSGDRVCRSGWQDPGNRCLTRKFLLASSPPLFFIRAIFLCEIYV